MQNKLELLSPAGNLDSFKAACASGANAIYMGLDKFNARQMAENFTIEKYIECIEYAHARNIKVYQTLNTLIYDDEINEALELLLKLYNEGLDAVIVQDIGLASLIREILPDLAIHASTQMSVYDIKQVRFLEKMGFTRIVLARELSILEIEELCKNTKLEIEVFVHGALCVSVSGQCLLSSVVGDRSANRGKCAQPCRMKYSLYDASHKLIEENKYLLSKKDIYGLEYIERLLNAGVNSLKIEGRNKTAEYVALTTSTYRKYIDNINLKVDKKDEKRLMQMFNRNGLSTGYLEGVRYKNSITLSTPKNTGLFLGEVVSQEKDFIKVKLEENIDLHDGIEIYNLSGEIIYSTIVTCIKDEKQKILNKEVDKGIYVYLGDVKKKIEFGSKIYKTSSDKLNKTLRENMRKENIANKLEFDVEISILKDKNISAKLKLDGKVNTIQIEYIPQTAISKELDIDQVKNTFEKSLEIPFNINLTKINIDKMLFVPVSKLNEIRRLVVENIYESIKVKRNIKVNILQILTKRIENNKINKLIYQNAIHIYKYDKTENYIQSYQKKYEKELERIEIQFFDYKKNSEDILKKYLGKVDIYLVIPNVVGKNLDEYIINNLSDIIELGIKGFIIGNLGYLEILKKFKKIKDIKLIGNYFLNIANIYSAMYFTSMGIDSIIPSFDISITDIENMSKVTNIELLNNNIIVLTSRYCMLGSFVSNRDETKKCTMPCKSSRYFLNDTYGYKYDIICDDTDCIMHLVKKNRNIDLKEYNILNLTSVKEAVI